jgi:hypothetical protein
MNNDPPCRQQGDEVCFQYKKEEECLVLNLLHYLSKPFTQCCRSGEAEQSFTGFSANSNEERQYMPDQAKDKPSTKPEKNFGKRKNETANFLASQHCGKNFSFANPCTVEKEHPYAFRVTSGSKNTLQIPQPSGDNEIAKLRNPKKNSSTSYQNSSNDFYREDRQNEDRLTDASGYDARLKHKPQRKLHYTKPMNLRSDSSDCAADSEGNKHTVQIALKEYKKVESKGTRPAKGMKKSTTKLGNMDILYRSKIRDVRFKDAYVQPNRAYALRYFHNIGKILENENMEQSASGLKKT